MAATMQALVVTEPGSYELSQVPVPSPGPTEALCRVRAIAVCGTDPHIIEGDFPGFWPPAHPFIPGHEWSGEIVTIGNQAGALGWSVGDRVAGSSHAGCGFCRKCQLGRYNLCENYGKPSLHSQYGHTTQGAYATFVVHSLKSLTKIPPTMPFDHAAMLDTTSIAMHTVNRARLRVGEDAAVVGSGVMGLLAAECLRVAGAARVFVVGRGPRLRRAAELGYVTVDTADGDPSTAVRELTAGLRGRGCLGVRRIGAGSTVGYRSPASRRSARRHRHPARGGGVADETHCP